MKRTNEIEISKKKQAFKKYAMMKYDIILSVKIITSCIIARV